VVYSWLPAGSNRESLGSDRGSPMSRNGDIIAAVSVGTVGLRFGSGIGEATIPNKLWDRLETIAWSVADVCTQGINGGGVGGVGSRPVHPYSILSHATLTTYLPIQSNRYHGVASTLLPRFDQGELEMKREEEKGCHYAGRPWRSWQCLLTNVKASSLNGMFKPYYAISHTQRSSLQYYPQGDSL